MIMDINELSSKIIGAAIEVHKALGPGLLESHPVKYCFIRNCEVYPIIKIATFQEHPLGEI